MSEHGRVRIATRGSELALWQANFVKSTLEGHWPGLVVELEIVVTDGDRIQDRPLHAIGGKGLFVKGIEAKLLDGSADLAVHSMKDLPAEMPDALVIACTPPREDPRDALVGPAGHTLASLPAGAKVGTGSLRRAALVARTNPAVEVVPLRGNVPTRLRKATSGELDAVILAAAGLRRLGLDAHVTEWLDPAGFCPAPAQGILALQCRADDARVRGLLAPMGDADAAVAAAAERAFLTTLGAGCTVPVGCHAHRDDDGRWRVAGIVVGSGGRPYFAAEQIGAAGDAAAIGARVAEQLLELGARDVLGT